MKHLIYQSGGEPISAIIAEKGEVYKDLTGSINKIGKKAPSHDGGTLIVDDKEIKSPKGRGGILLQDVTHILSASQNQVNSGKRKDSVKDDIVAINKDEAEEFARQFGLKIKIGSQISPSLFFEKLKSEKDKTVKRIGEKSSDVNLKDKNSQTSFEANMAIANSMPTDDELFDNIFQLQESKKDQSGVNFDSETNKYGGIKKYQQGGPYSQETSFVDNWFKKRAGFDVNQVPRRLSHANIVSDPNLISKRKDSTIQGYFQQGTNKLVINDAADDKPSTFVHELTHAAQRNGLPNYDYTNIVSREQMAKELGNDNYLLSPMELHSRLMQYRRDNGLKPTDKIDSMYMSEADDLNSGMVSELNSAKRNHFIKNNTYRDYGVDPIDGKTLKNTYKDGIFIDWLREEGIRGDVQYKDLSEKDKAKFDNLRKEYDDNAAFELMQAEPDFESRFFKQKGMKVLKDPTQYNLPKGDVLKKILNGLTSNVSTEDLNQAQYGDSVSRMGYRDDSPYRNNSSNMIESNVIDMSATGKHLIGISNTGDIKKMQPYSGQYEFDGDSVLEMPMGKYGSDGEGGGGGNSYSPAQLKYHREQNALRANKIKNAMIYLRNPNLKPEDRTRLEGEVKFLQGEMISLDGPSGKKKVVVGKDNKSTLKNSDFVKGAIKANPAKDNKSTLSNKDFVEGALGEIPTDTVYKKNGVAGTPMTQDQIDEANGVLVPPPVPSILIPVEEQQKQAKTVAQDNPISAPVVKQEETPKEPNAPAPPIPPAPPAQAITEIDNTNRDLKWYDVAGDFMNLLDASQRTSPILRQLNLPRIKLAKGSVDPQVNQVRQNYLSALSALNADDTVGASNVNQLMTNANQQEINILAQGRNANIDVQNREEIANQAIASDETIRNLQLQEDFVKKVLMTDEAQRRQKLTSFQNLFDKVAKNNRFNRTENAFQSVFAKNFRVNENGRIEYNPNQDNDPTFYAPSGVQAPAPKTTTVKKTTK